MGAGGVALGAAGGATTAAGAAALPFEAVPFPPPVFAESGE
ncbi:hypothetical protein RHOER0001_3816 [Rhodococcus erythropolis SK121]|nr:hypothetical protein RHOER0001_3816 [Rhodococcus erythropolis SK121]